MHPPPDDVTSRAADELYALVHGVASSGGGIDDVVARVFELSPRRAAALHLALARSELRLSTEATDEARTAHRFLRLLAATGLFPDDAIDTSRRSPT
ncbi:MAG TPA: hypothetical protein VF230_19215 [Acidimicrobiales bacterium]